MNLDAINFSAVDHPRDETLSASLQLIRAAIAELNPQLPKEQQLEGSAGTPIYGNNGKLDSLGMANLIVILEQKIEEHYGFRVDLMQDDTISLGGEHFKTVNSLDLYISRIVHNRKRTES